MYNFFKKQSKNLIVFAFYVVVALVLTYPLINNFSTAMPGGGGDSFLFAWNQWWVKYSLLNLQQNPYFTDLISYPFTTNLVFHTLTFTNSLVSVPLQLFLPNIIAFNMIFILSLILAAYGMYLLAYYLFKNYFVAIISGIMFVFNSYVFSVIGLFQYTSIYVIPFFILFFIKIFRENKVKNALLAGLILALSFYNEFYYTVGLFIFALLIMLWLAIKDKKFLLSKIKDISLCFFTWLILSLPLLYLSIKTALAKVYPLATLSQINLYSPDIKSFFIPSHLHAIFGEYFKSYYESLNYHGSIVYLSFILLILAIIGYFFGKRQGLLHSSKLWFFIAIIFFFLTLGPFLYFDGYIFDLDGVKFTIPLPYLFFYLLPFVKGILVPPRFIIFVIFCLIMIGGFLLERIFNKLNKKLLLKSSIALLITGVFIFENFSTPIQISNAQIPDFYHQISKEENDYTILELPFALSTSFYTLGSIKTSSILEYYQTVHHKKIINGWISRVPDEYYNFYSKIIGLDYLINPQVFLDAEKINNIKSNVVDNFSKLNIKYIIIHPEYYNHNQLRNTIGFLNNIFEQEPRLINNMLIYKIK